MPVEDQLEVSATDCRVPVLASGTALRIDQEKDERRKILRQHHEFRELARIEQVRITRHPGAARAEYPTGRDWLACRQAFIQYAAHLQHGQVVQLAAALMAQIMHCHRRIRALVSPRLEAVLSETVEPPSTRCFTHTVRMPMPIALFLSVIVKLVPGFEIYSKSQ